MPVSLYYSLCMLVERLDGIFILQRKMFVTQDLIKIQWVKIYNNIQNICAVFNSSVAM